MKKILGIAIAAAMLFSIIIVAFTIGPSNVGATSTIFGDYAYKGGYFYINMVEQAGNGKIANIYGTFEYRPSKNEINGKVTITIMDVNGNQLAKYPGTITYKNGVLQIVDNSGRVYYNYAAPTAREAFWKGLIAVYEYEMHRNIKPWRKIEMTVVNPQNHSQQGYITAYQAEITPVDKFEQMNLGQFGLLGPFKYYIIKIPDPKTNIIVSVKLVVIYNDAVIFSQEIGIIPPQNQAQ